jgi:hypothetical protein
MDLAEFRRLGFLQEANRQFFHPLGLALVVREASDGSVTLEGVADYRDDPEGIMFEAFEPGDIRRADEIESLRQSRIDAREKFGFVNGIQPLKSLDDGR